MVEGAEDVALMGPVLSDFTEPMVPHALPAVMLAVGSAR
jgi:hypothetical protein